MAEIVVHPEKLDAESARLLEGVCPFGAITRQGETVVIGPGCRMCGACVRKGPPGAVEIRREEKPRTVDKSQWRGVAVFAEQQEGQLHNVTRELLGKARALASVIGHPVYAVVMGCGMDGVARELLRYGADRVYVYDDEALRDFRMEPYTAAFADFVEQAHPCAVLVGATNMGRSLAPRTAARFRTGITADCTKLEMRENTDLVQIRPAFGGNIMAQIVTTRTRPQFCTVRYKIFPQPKPETPHGTLIPMTLPTEKLATAVEILEAFRKPRETDLSEAEVVVACGRGFRTKEDLRLAEELADALGGVVACTRPLVEAGWLSQKRQIGLSGRTVAAKLLVALGISGSVQFAAGMKGSALIVAVNSDEAAPIFDIAHYGVVGDLYQVVPELLRQLREARDDI